MSASQEAPDGGANAELEAAAPRRHSAEESQGSQNADHLQDAEDEQAGRDVYGRTAEDPDTDADGDLDEEFAAYMRSMHGSGKKPPRAFMYAPGGLFNLGSVEGGQHVNNQGDGPAAGWRSPSHDGPLFAEEILTAGDGFAEPSWFSDALRALDSRLLLLTGTAGTGRRTAALNLLHRHSDSMILRGVDATVDFAEWRPDGDEVRGYLVDGLSQPQQLLKGWLVNQLIGRLRKAKARMVIVLPDAPGLVRELRRELPRHVVTCVPPSTREVFAARFEARVPDAEQRDRILTALGREQVGELLGQDLSPAHVAELVDEVVLEESDFVTILERMSFLAEQEVPELIDRLRDQPPALAFLLASCVFEGLDYRIVQEEADRLLELADQRLDAKLPGTREEEESRSNPRFVFGDSMDDLLRGIGARQMPREVRSASGYGYSVEPVRFIRHGRSQAVLRHVWREYGQVSGLMTDWLEKARPENELIRPIGEVMGMAARWGGGRRALSHISALARSPERGTRQVAAAAMAIAAQDPVLAGEIRYRLTRWSLTKGWKLRATVAYTCATAYGVSRPDHALTLLGRLMYGQDDTEGHPVTSAVSSALRALFTSGQQSAVIRRLSEWADEDGRRSEVALTSFTYLLQDIPWCAGQLHAGTDAAEHIVGLVHQALNEEEHFDRTRRAILSWRQVADWDEQSRDALEALLFALSYGMQHGVLRLFVSIDRDENDSTAGKDIARQALTAWRNGQPTHTSSGTGRSTSDQRSPTR
ncbi:hypothetical protein JW613_05530 [Streptomyces smyrnaeus]|uniref:ATP-binding protein n=1 Tax=Streptomyces smyrnaeus TaxID=1387713 RepID=A0ABS3XQR4_9ACTN|nr:hypothetical protein [Streptomyces smyrnaeus]MBO8197763.1 hypothetical protein [Streptomyces smyrnaeus]